MNAMNAPELAQAHSPVTAWPLEENLWGYLKRLRFVHEHASAISAQTVLDIGCGNGSQLAIPLGQLGYRVTGIDPHKASIERAQMHGTGNFICGFSHDLPTCNFDVVIISEVLEHLHDPQCLLADSLRFIAPNGILIVTVPNGYGEFEIDSRLYYGARLNRAFDGFYRLRRRLIGKPDPAAEVAGSDDTAGHVQRFTLKHINRLFLSCGLGIKDKRPGPFLAGPLVSNTLARIPGFLNFNVSISDRLPMVLSSGWLFCLKQ